MVLRPSSGRSSSGGRSAKSLVAHTEKACQNLLNRSRQKVSDTFFGLAPRLLAERPVVRSSQPMPLTTRMWSAGKLLLLAGALTATYVIFALVSMRVALRSREVQVPNLVNHTANEATSIAGA